MALHLRCILVAALFLVLLPLGQSIKVWLVSTTQESEDTSAEDSEQLEWLVDLLQKDHFPRQREPLGAATTRPKDEKTKNYELLLDETSDHEISFEDQQKLNKQKKEYHVHYHTHQHIMNRDKKIADSHHISPANLKYNVYSSEQKSFPKHLADFKDFETLSKKETKYRANEYEQNENFKNYRPPQLGILDFPGGSPKLRHRVPLFEIATKKNTTSMIDKPYGRFVTDSTEHGQNEKQRVLKLENLRKVGSMNGWMIYSWA